MPTTNSLAGSVWRLTDVRAFGPAGREQPSPMAPQTMGVIAFEAERMMGAIGDALTLAPPGAPPRRFTAYTGAYTFDGQQIVATVDAATGSDLMGPQVRQVRFEGEARMVLTPPTRADGVIVEVGWERLR
jgi:hypothetical protein